MIVAVNNNMDLKTYCAGIKGIAFMGHVPGEIVDGHPTKQWRRYEITEETVDQLIDDLLAQNYTFCQLHYEEK